MNRHAHFEAILARARARPNLNVYDTEAPLNIDGTIMRDSFVVLHDVGADWIRPIRYGEARTSESTRQMRVVARCVGEDAAAVRRIVAVVDAQFTGWTPIVAGRTCWPLVLDNEGEIEDDDTVKPPIPFVDLDFIYRTAPKG